MPTPLRVAIIGGSISGCTLANGLLRHDHLEFDIFESKSSFQERGAAIALHTNALAALRHLGLDVDELLREARANKRDRLQTIVGCGEHKGKEFMETIPGPWGAGRQQLLAELIKHLPKDRLHCNKKLVTIDREYPDSSGPLLLRFDDGSTHTADTVVGCDGFRSKVRQLVLGPDNAANAPVFAGFWDARGLLPTQQAVEKFGIDIIDARADQLTAVVGDGSFILSGPIDNGQMTFINVVGTPPPGWDGSALKTELDREHLERAFRGWDERFVKGIVDCVMTSGPGVIFNQWESAPSPKYFNGNICMIGDAAHATSNWLGQGAAMAMEDCAVLAGIFKDVKCETDFQLVYQAFDQVRHGKRPEMVIEQSRLCGQILTGQMGLDPAAVAKYNTQAKRLEILSFDIGEDVIAAQEAFHKLRDEARRLSKS